MNDNTPACDCQNCQGKASANDRILRFLYFIVLLISAFYLLRPLVIVNLLDRAALYETNGYKNDALRLYHRVIFLDKTNEDAWCLLAEIHQKMGQPESYLQILHESLAVNPHNLVALASLGMKAVMDRDWLAAIEYFEKVRRLGPLDKIKWSSRKTIYYKASLSILSAVYHRLGQKNNEKLINDEIARIIPSGRKISG